MNIYNILELEPGPLLDEAILLALGAVRVLEPPPSIPDHVRPRWPEGGVLVLTDADGNEMYYGTPPPFTAGKTVDVPAIGHENTFIVHPPELLIGAVKKLVAAKLGDNVPLGKPDLVGTPSAIVGPPR